MALETAALQCRCGACCIELVDPTPRTRCQCFCWDCRQRGLIAADRRPQNALPAAVLNYERGIDLYYFTNALRVLPAAHDLLDFFKLREDSANTTARSRCCGTLMCGAHPLYGGNTIWASADSCRVTLPAPIPNQLYIFGTDVPAARYAALTLEPGVPMIFSFYDELETPAARALIAAVTAPRPACCCGDDVTAFEALQTGRPITIDNAYYAVSRGA